MTSTNSTTLSDHDRSSFPTGLTVPEGRQQAMSVISSAMSDVPESEGVPQSLGATGPAGEPGLPPSRPSTAATTKTGVTSKRAPGSAAGSRPPSSYSRTHVPSLTSSAFFRPMSSQRLQAQRGQRPISNVGPRSVPSSEQKENRAPGTATSTRTTSTAAPGLGQTTSVSCDILGIRSHHAPIRL
jgi:palmitoyltransferase ZDHHC9/14/18